MAIPSIIPYDLPTAQDLAPNQARWQLDARRAVLLVHDMQQYFVDFFPAGEPPVVDVVRNIAIMRDAAVRACVPVVYTAQPGGMTPGQRGLLREFWGPGMGTLPRHRRIVPALAPGPDDPVVTKWRYSAFARTELADLIRAMGRDQLVVCGVYAHVGCLMTACDAFTLDIEPFVVADAVADFTLEDHLMALRWAARRCAVTLWAEEVVLQLTALPRGQRAS